ncbi:dihydroorotate dehydrogenase (quinone), partial [Fischerella thermalis WC441]
MDIYQALIRPFFFDLLDADPEWLHYSTIRSLSWLANNNHRPPASWIAKRLQNSLSVTDKRLEQTLFGLHFPNPVGLAAGFDKDGVATSIWSNFGFGF